MTNVNYISLNLAPKASTSSSAEATYPISHGENKGRQDSEEAYVDNSWEHQLANLLMRLQVLKKKTEEELKMQEEIYIDMLPNSPSDSEALRQKRKHQSYISKVSNKIIRLQAKLDRVKRVLISLQEELEYVQFTKSVQINDYTLKYTSHH